MYYLIFEITIHGPPVQKLLWIKLLIICLIQLPSHKVHVLKQIDFCVCLKVVQTCPSLQSPPMESHGPQ